MSDVSTSGIFFVKYGLVTLIYNNLKILYYAKRSYRGNY